MAYYLSLILLLVFASLSDASAQTSPGSDPGVILEPFSTVLHEEVLIPASPQAIWPYLFRSQTWRTGTAKMQWIKGGDEEVGRIIEWIYPNRNRIKVMTLSAKMPCKAAFQLFNDDGTLRGVSLYTLIPQGKATLLHYDVLLKEKTADFPDNSENYVKTLSAGLKKDLENLKKMLSN